MANIYEIKVSISNFIKPTQGDPNTIITDNFNIPLASIDRPSRHKFNKETSRINDTLDQLDLTDTHRVFNQTITEYTFFSEALRNFSKIDCILRHKTKSPNKYKKIEIISCILSEQNGIKLEINNKRNWGKCPNTRRLNHSL
jgi:hypothetical protein